MVAPLAPSPFAGSNSYALVSRGEPLAVPKGRSMQAAARPGMRYRLVRLTEAGEEAVLRVIALSTPEGDLALLADDGTQIVLKGFFSTPGAEVELPGAGGEASLIDSHTPHPAMAHGGYDIVHAAGDTQALAALAHDFAGRYDVLQPARFDAAVTSLHMQPFTAGIATPSLALLGGGLIAGAIAAVAGSTGGSTPAAHTPDAGTTPDAAKPQTPTSASLTILPVTGDNYISVAEEEEGVVLSGLATGLADETVVTITWGNVTRQTRVYEGVWSIDVASIDIPSNAAGQRVVVTAGSLRQEQALTFETMYVQAVTIDPIAGDDLVTRAEREGGIVVSGATKNAPDGSVVTVDWRGHSIDAVVAGNRWSVTFAADEVPQESADVSTEVNAYLVDVSASRSVVVQGPAPIDTQPGLTIDPVTGDDSITPAERNGDVTVSGQATGLADGTLVTLTWGSATRMAMVAGGIWSATFDSTELPESNTLLEARATPSGGTEVTAANLVEIAYPTVQASRLAANLGGFAVSGDTTGLHVGASMGHAGDIDGDGLDDFIFSVDAGAGGVAKAYVVLGRTSGPAPTIAQLASGIGGFEILGEYPGVSLVVHAAGDVNGDGLSDIAIGAPGPAGDAAYSGGVYVIFGKTDTTAVSLSAIAAGHGGFVIGGACAEDRAGYAVDFAGDVDGDGYGDLIIGAPGAEESGRAYVVYGKSDSASVFLSAVAAGSGGFAIDAEVGGGFGAGFGASVSAGGDLNGDGLADLLVGAPNERPDGLVDGGRLYVLFGTTSGAFARTMVDWVGSAGADEASDEGQDSVLVAGAGNDILHLVYGDSVAYAGSGDDVVRVSQNFIYGLTSGDRSHPHARVDGGSGFDTLSLDGGNLLLDLTAIANPGAGLQPGASRLASIERIDLTGTGDNRLKLSLADLFDMTESNVVNSGKGWAALQATQHTHQLVVTGDTGDRVELDTLTGWTTGNSLVVDGIQYTAFEHAAASVALYVQSSVAGPFYS